MSGSKNPMYKDGRRSYRKITGATSGQIVHHKDGDRTNNTKSNLKVISKSQRSAHEKAHNREKNFKKTGGRKSGAHMRKSNPK